MIEVENDTVSGVKLVVLERFQEDGFVKVALERPWPLFGERPEDLAEVVILEDSGCPGLMTGKQYQSEDVG